MLSTNGGWPIERLRPNPENPRTNAEAEGFDELVASIEAQGILQPLLVSKDGLILAGHRRYEAAKRVGLESVPVRVLVEVEPGDFDAIFLIENLMRADLGVLETADYLAKLQGRRELNPPEISNMTGIGVETVRRYLKIAQAPDDLRALITDGKMTLSAALELLPHGPQMISVVVAEANKGAVISRVAVKEIVGNGGIRPTLSSEERRQEDVSWALERFDLLRQRLAKYNSDDLEQAIAGAEKVVMIWSASQPRKMDYAPTELRTRSSLLN